MSPQWGTFVIISTKSSYEVRQLLFPFHRCDLPKATPLQTRLWVEMQTRLSVSVEGWVCTGTGTVSLGQLSQRHFPGGRRDPQRNQGICLESRCYVDGMIPILIHFFNKCSAFPLGLSPLRNLSLCPRTSLPEPLRCVLYMALGTLS